MIGTRRMHGIGAAGAGDRGFTLLRSAWAWLKRTRRASLTRRCLAEMDDRLLSDIGLSRADAVMELGRMPWDTAWGTPH